MLQLQIQLDYTANKSVQNSTMQDQSQEEISVYEQDLNSGHMEVAKQQGQECPLCSQASLQILISNALYHKYLDSQYLNYLKYIDNIMDNELCTQAIKYREMAIIDDQQQFMRRMYSSSQYEYKNKAIVQYYKFHHDYPKLHIKGVSRIMEGYGDRKKEFQYKKIKRILKQEEDISITTQKSSSVFSDIQEQDKRSHYSNVLSDVTLNSMLFNEEPNESQVWKNMCRKMDKAFETQPLSPLNFRKKSASDQIENKQKNQTKNFLNYLKKHQEKKEKQEKYKNFIRSNQQSKYNSIQHQTKQYASGVPSASSLIKKLTKVQKQKPVNSFKESNAFYDGRLFYNKGNFGSMSKEQRTKQQTNAPSQQNLEFDNYFPQNGFKKNKQPSGNAYRYKNQKNNNDQFHEEFQTQKQSNNQIDMRNFKSKPNIKTTEFIYKNATSGMGLKKRATSYNSLATTNRNSKRNSVINPSALKEREFEIRNRVSSHNGKLFNDKNGLINNLMQPKSAFDLKDKLQKSKSSSNIKTTRSVPKFYHPETTVRTQNKVNQNSNKKISISKDMMKALKGKSYSTSKLKSEAESSQKSGNPLQKQISKQRKKDVNLFIQNGLKNKPDLNNLMHTNYVSKNMDIDKLLSKKLLNNVQSQRIKQHKILI